MNLRHFLFVLSAALLPFAAYAADAQPAATPKAPAARKPDTSLAPVADVAGLPRVLLIGDSISMGYTVPVRELLKGVANVHRIPANGGDTGSALEKIDTWLLGNPPTKPAPKWDVIHFNWGLHDLKHWKDGKLDLAGPQVSSVEQYEKNLRALVAKLQATGAKLIWCTTTPVPEGSAGRVEGDEAKYNAAAKRIMEENKIRTDDLAAFVSPRVTELQLPHNVHFTPAGYRALAEKVAESIRAQLKK
jgi:acyl-CoA thioesterase-1